MIPRLKDLVIKYREIKGLSRRGLSEYIGLSEKTIQNLETADTYIGSGSAKEIGRSIGLSEYNILISYNYFEVPVIGNELRSNEILTDEQMFEELSFNYTISALPALSKEIRENEAYQTGISKERLEKIRLSFSEDTNVSIEETISLCKVFDKLFSELFVLVAVDFVSDRRAIDVAHTFQKFIQRQTKPPLTFEQIDSKLTSDEIEYLIESLNVYRKLGLTQTK
ncbi:hypothetical protein [Paenibacillus glacialis]|uniref:HTH cro/C1-type domain-containing protein n=1 Tax=Paenibacillus glacialis TaxID=494026 RepID=A0A168NNX5_9BACL|nr:hypothetical protein [Paenibacillus glacialis]OAB45979.1 hypothetical protein PGLA_00860 [Paenibacillus glacialis]